MDVFWELDSVPEDFGPTVVTLGNFDGVHRGHQAVLGRVADIARKHSLRSIAMTFDPHPRVVHQPESKVHAITGLSERLVRMSLTGVDATLVQHYDLDFAAQTAAEFVKTYLVDGLHARVVAVGQDVRFGSGNTGTIDTLHELGAEYGFEVITIDDVGEGDRYSSTRVRELLLDGHVRAAAEVLGASHVVAGTVVHGDARGREMGFPTANLGKDAVGMVPADGVYAGWAEFDSDPERYPAAISVGTNPTFDGQERRVEAHVIGVEFPDMDVYGSRMTLQFVDRIRGQVTFDSMADLVERMHQDVADAEAVLAEARQAGA